MSDNPSSVFGYGVVLSPGRPEEDPREDSPYSLFGGERSNSGIVVYGSGSQDLPGLMILIKESASQSENWAVHKIEDAAVGVQPDWDARIEAYLDRWNLRVLVAPGFERPCFIHAPYYS